jgi:Cft2 family RNA processing exonuclease
MKRLLFLSFIPLIFLGCSEKQVVKYVKIKPTYHKLEVYNEPQELKLHIKGAKIKGKEKICVKEFDACLNRKSFLELINYINEYKTISKNYKNEIMLYNKTYSKDAK